MENIPDDVLIAIATQLRCEPAAAAHLFCFVRVCRRWNAFGLPLLYGNISLVTRTLEPFGRTFLPEKYGSLVRSLSLRVGAIGSLLDPYPFDADSKWDSWNNLDLPTTRGIAAPSNNPWLTPETMSRTKYLISTFDLYPPILTKLSNLASFSLVIEANASWCRPPRAKIAALVEALPAACVHLELDTHGNESPDRDHPKHICEHIRHILPRLWNLRLRTGTMCSALFELPESAPSEEEQNTDREKSKKSGFITLSHLQSLVLNCGVFVHGDLLPQCGYDGFRRYEIGAEAWCAITSSLTGLVVRQAANLANATVLVVSPTWAIHTDLSLDTHLRTDMVNKTTWAVPCIPGGNGAPASQYFLIRGPNESEQVVLGLEYMDDVAEGHIWNNVMGGARLPTTILEAERKELPSFATGCVARLAEDLMEQWLEVRPGVRKSRTFRNEQKTGMKLVSAEKRTGHHFFALRPVSEITPNGWVRTPHLELEPA